MDLHTSKRAVLASAATLAASPALALADEPRIAANPQGTIVNALNTIANYFLTIILGLAVIYILIAAFRYLNAQGNPAEISKVHAALKWSLIAIAVAILAKGLASLVGGIAQTL